MRPVVLTVCVVAALLMADGALARRQRSGPRKMLIGFIPVYRVERELPVDAPYPPAAYSYSPSSASYLSPATEDMVFVHSNDKELGQVYYGACIPASSNGMKETTSETAGSVAPPPPQEPEGQSPPPPPPPPPQPPPAYPLVQEPSSELAEGQGQVDAFVTQPVDTGSQPEEPAVGQQVVETVEITQVTSSSEAVEEVTTTFPPPPPTAEPPAPPTRPRRPRPPIISTLQLPPLPPPPPPPPPPLRPPPPFQQPAEPLPPTITLPLTVTPPNESSLSLKVPAKPTRIPAKGSRKKKKPQAVPRAPEPPLLLPLTGPADLTRQQTPPEDTELEEEGERRALSFRDSASSRNYFYEFNLPRRFQGWSLRRHPPGITPSPDRGQKSMKRQVI